jgi:MFS family permease
MYQIQSSRSLLLRPTPRGLRALALRLANRNVVFLGLTSFFTDISSEMVSTVLPLYIIYGLHLSPLQFGVVDGIYQGAAALVRLAGGILADRLQRYRAIAIAGYGISAVCRLGMLIIGTSLSTVGGWVMLDRVGKGLRTAPRDALIALSTESSSHLAASFGLHRAFDSAGAMLGPLVAFLLLGLLPGAFDAIFVVSFCFALIGLATLVLFVEDHSREPSAKAKLCRAHHHAGHGSVRCPNCRNAPPIPPGASLRKALALLRIPRFAALLAVGTLLGLLTLSDGFLFLNVQRRLDLSVGFFPLLYVITAFFYMLLALPAGRLADRFGRGRVFLAGYGLLLLVYVLLLTPEIPRALLLASVVLLGTYYAATDGVLMALTSAILPTPLQASGMALLATTVGLARLCSSLLFGSIWTWMGADQALIGFAIGLSVATLGAAAVLRLFPQPSHDT